MTRPMTNKGIDLRICIRMEFDLGKDVVEIRRKYKTTPEIVDSGISKTVEEWREMLAKVPEDKPRIISGGPHCQATMPGFEQGIVKFTRKPAKMGEDFIFWIPRVYIRNGLVDPSIEYEIYIKKGQK